MTLPGIVLARQIAYTINMRFTWDEAKAASNLAKHGVPFEAAEAFEWATALFSATLRHPGGEPRLLARGVIGDRLHVMIYSIETGSVRIISLRRANEREINRYESEG